MKWHTWVALGTHAQGLLVRDPERFVAVLYWQPAEPRETEDGPVVADGTYILVAVNDPRDLLAIADESTGATEPTSAFWPSELLITAAEAYFAKWA